MTKDEFIKVIAWLDVAVGVPIANEDESRKIRLDVYFECLGDLPVDVFKIAAKRVAVAHPWKTFPSVAELRQAAAETLQGHVASMSGGEAWQLAWSAVARIDPEVEGSTARACHGLPPLVIEAMRNFGIVALCQANPNFARTQFIEIFESLVARESKHALLPASVKKAIGQAAKELPSSVKAITAQVGKE
jgi:hypothetical protein